jgi:hypothetical protein
MKRMPAACAARAEPVAGQDLDQGRLPGAVVTEEGVHFAAAQLEVHAIERGLTVEDLGQALHGQRRSRGRHLCHCWIRHALRKESGTPGVAEGLDGSTVFLR